MKIRKRKKQYKIGICTECKVREGDSSKKKLYKCPYCKKWFCEKHIKPRLTITRSAIERIKDPVLREKVYEEWRKEDGHPDYIWTRQYFENLEIKEREEREKVWKALDKLKESKEISPYTESSEEFEEEEIRDITPKISFSPPIYNKKIEERKVKRTKGHSIANILLVTIIITTLVIILYLYSSYRDLYNNYQTLFSKYNELNKKYDNLYIDYQNLLSDYNKLNSEYSELSSNYKKIKERYKNLSYDVVRFYDFLYSYVNLPESFKRVLNENAINKTSKAVIEAGVVPFDLWYSIQKIYEYITNNIQYAKDIEMPYISGYWYVTYEKENYTLNFYNEVRTIGEYIQSPELTLKIKQGDCEDQAILAYAMIKYYMKYVNGIDYDLYLAEIEFSNSSHVSVILPVEGRKICIIDPAGHYLTNSFGRITSKEAFQNYKHIQTIGQNQ